MKIQVEGKLSEKALLKTFQEVESQEHQDETTAVKNSQSWCHGRCSCGSMLTLGIVLLTLLVVHMWVFFYYLLKVDTAAFTEGGKLSFADSQGEVKELSFSWFNCGGENDTAKVKVLQVGPDPIPILGNITVTLDATLSENLDSPIKTSVTVMRKVGFVWIEIPCLFGLGSCDYPDLCEVIPFSKDKPCPYPFPEYSLPCHCPIPSAHYLVKDGIFPTPIPKTLIPPWLETGSYYVKTESFKEDHRVSCLKFYLEVIGQSDS
ncbi:ganglioside GM2 activator-like isoform X2 [Oratosquilla oratoria]|uniref:ganglioside GM2 activator-like isoform X2 n=1 Tax=Oratosquilla oratoria TaxID=337810 RepID=UPI003F7656FD